MRTHQMIGNSKERIRVPRIDFVERRPHHMSTVNRPVHIRRLEFTPILLSVHSIYPDALWIIKN